MENQNNYLDFDYKHAEVDDYRREREILAEETISGKNTFATEMRDVLGEQIKAELAKKKTEVPEKIEKPKGIHKFLDKLSQICR